jgi:hypothetical protein
MLSLVMTVFAQNPEEPEKKPVLQSYTIDLNKTGPMVRSALSRFRALSYIHAFHNIVTGTRRAHQDQERGGLDADIPKIVPRGHLRLLRYEYRWTEYPCMPVPHRQKGEQGHENLPPPPQ